MNPVLEDFITQIRRANNALQEQQRIISRAERTIVDNVAKEIVKEVRRQI